MVKPKYKIPVSFNDRLELEVDTLASSGDGVCHYNGYTIFVPTAVPGDHIICKIVKTTPRFGVARIIELLIPSRNRVEPLCPVFPQCGGCTLQQLSYEKQMEFKTRVVIDDLERIGSLDLSLPIRTLPAEPPWYYRNKGSFAIQYKGGDLSIGFFKQGTHEVVDSNRCDILHPPINTIKEIIRNHLKTYKISIYNEINHKGFGRGIIARYSEHTKEILLGLVTTQGKFPSGFIEKLVETIYDSQISLVGIVQNLNLKRTNVILGNRNQILWGRGYLIDHLGDLKFRVSLPSFFQTNTQQTIKLYNLIRDWVTPAQGIVIDAYCGVGGIALWLGREGNKVIGIEENPEAVNDAVKNANENRITSCRFMAGLVEDKLRDIDRTKNIGVVILDPPRKGCSEQVIQSIPTFEPKQLIYVSCNPATLARDLSKLKAFRYIVQDICVIDMFPQTQHIEVAVLLTPE